MQIINLSDTYVSIKTGFKTIPMYQIRRGKGFTIIHVRENNHGRGEGTAKKQFMRDYCLEIIKKEEEDDKNGRV